MHHGSVGVQVPSHHAVRLCGVAIYQLYKRKTPQPVLCDVTYCAVTASEKCFCWRRRSGTKISRRAQRFLCAERGGRRRDVRVRRATASSNFAETIGRKRVWEAGMVL